MLKKVLLLFEKNSWTWGKQINLREDETLADVAKKYQCLYEKSFPGYKEKDQWKPGKHLRKRLVLKKVVIDDFQKVSLHVSAIYQSDNYQHFMMYCFETSLWHASSKEYRPWSLIFYWICKVLFVFIRKSIFYVKWKWLK